MDQSELDLAMDQVLLHASKARAYMRRLKARHPDKWQHCFGNIFAAHNQLKPQTKQVSKYLIGVFDPKMSDRWPWHCHYEAGLYLSAKKRLCKRERAAQFNDPDAARELFHTWKGKEHLKMEVIEVRVWVTDE